MSILQGAMSSFKAFQIWFDFLHVSLDVIRFYIFYILDISGIVEHTLKFALVARAVRIYPHNYTWPTCFRVELYGFYMIKGMCPDLSSKTREKNCTGNGVCDGTNKKCWKDSCKCVFSIRGGRGA